MHIHLIKEGLDWCVPCTHCRCASSDEKVVTQRGVLPSLLPWFSQGGSLQEWEAGWGAGGWRWYTLGLCPHCWNASFQFFVFLKWLWPRTNRQHSHSKQWNDNCFEVTENCFTVTSRHHIVPFPDSSLVWKNGMPHNTSVVMKVQSSVYCLENLQLLSLSRRNAEPSFGEA